MTDWIKEKFEFWWLAHGKRFEDRWRQRDSDDWTLKGLCSHAFLHGALAALRQLSDDKPKLRRCKHTVKGPRKNVESLWGKVKKVRW